jgi:4'-phosphopantetheinyl transferase
VTSRFDVGVDVESPQRPTEIVGLARRFFAESEVESLRSRPPEQQRAIFFEIWTLKEAYIKARGRGLSIPLDSFAFSLDPDRPPSIGFVPGTNDDPQDWQFAQVFLGSQYPMALALRSPGNPELTVRIREMVPLSGASEPVVLPPNQGRRWVLQRDDTTDF